MQVVEDYDIVTIKYETENWSIISMTHKFALLTLIALCSIALSKLEHSSSVVLDENSISGILMKADELQMLYRYVWILMKRISCFQSCL